MNAGRKKKHGRVLALMRTFYFASKTRRDSPRGASIMSRPHLHDAAQRFCSEFAGKKSIDTLLGHFSKTRPCEVIEYGLPELAPFLGKPFKGHDGVRHYFSTVAALITYENMHFPDSEYDYVVDTDARKVSVKGTAVFTWVATGKSWGETFAYVLDFDDEYKVTRYQIWGDTGAMYLATQGRLRQVGDQQWHRFTV